MQYRLINKDAAQTIILLHGTGGDENDLIFLGELIDSKANILGLRGRVNEHGMNRFFKRIRPGVFDEESLIKETKYLHTYIKNFANINHFDLDKITLIGFSNGANILASLIYHFGKQYRAFALLHPMIPLKDFSVVEQDQNPIFISAGMNDPIVDYDEVKMLKNVLTNHGAIVDFHTYKYGHSLSEKEIQDIKSWYHNI